MPADAPSKVFIKPSDPIKINTSAHRTRSLSVSSSSPNSDSPSELQTPSPTSHNSPRFGLPQAGSSPILSYFLSQSPVKMQPSATFPFNRKFGPPAVFEEEEEVPVAVHARRASTAVAGRFAQQQPVGNIPEPQLERGSGLLRRLSLSSGALVKPQGRPLPPPSPPPNTAVSPLSSSRPFVPETKPRRSATLNEGSRPHRAPSPMGERILKGHFDGFN